MILLIRYFRFVFSFTRHIIYTTARHATKIRLVLQVSSALLYVASMTTGTAFASARPNQRLQYTSRFTQTDRLIVPGYPMPTRRTTLSHLSRTQHATLGYSPQIQLATGVSFHSEILPTIAGPEYITLLNIDLTVPTLHLGIVQAHDRLVSNDEVLTSMANRSGALIGINGDFFEINGSGRPIGMLAMNGQLVQSPAVYAVLQQLPDKRVTISSEAFSGAVIDGSASHWLNAVNHFAEAAHGALVLATPALGAGISLPAETIAFLHPNAGSPGTFTVTALQTNATYLPPLAGLDALLGAGSTGTWLSTSLHKGDHITITEHVSPNANPLNAIGGGPILILNGKRYNDPNPPAPGETNVRNPLTAISVSQDGLHIQLAVFDGRYADPTGSPGLTHAEATRYLLEHGAYQAMLFDSGGSSEMVARWPGQHAVSIVNWPSGGVERPVANGLFLYSN